MDDIELRELYLKDLRRAPAIRIAILKAAHREDRTVAIPPSAAKDDPMLMCAAWGLARLENVTLLLSPGRRKRAKAIELAHPSADAKTFQDAEDMAM